MTEDTLIIDTGSAIQSHEPTVQPLTLYDENHPMLRVAMPEYTLPLPNPNMSLLIKRLKMTMKLYGGIGLSANQCGIFERVFVLGTDYFQFACINPKVIDVSDAIDNSQEGCLSFPGLYLKVPRPVSVHAEFMDENGEVKRLWLDGITARCFLHELDHMNGIRFVEKIGSVALSQARRKQTKLIKKVQRKK
jgi:peptide deformylase